MDHWEAHFQVKHQHLGLLIRHAVKELTWSAGSPVETDDLRYFEHLWFEDEDD